MATKIRVSNLHTDVKTMMQTMVDENAVDSADVTSIVNTNIASKSTSDISEGTNLYYTNARADARVALIVDAAPGTLNTLNELAAALGDDANFSTTVTNSIATKLPLAGGTITGNLTVNGDATFFKNTGGSSTYDFVSDHYTEIALTADYDGSHGGPHITSLIANGSTGSLAMRTSNVNRLQVAQNGDVNFFDDTGANAKFFWDASTERLGIGTDAPATALHVRGTASTVGATRSVVTLTDDTAMGINVGSGVAFRGLYTSAGAEANYGGIFAGKSNANSGNANGYLSLSYSASGTLTEGIRISETGYVGIGTATPARSLEVYNTSSSMLAQFKSGSGDDAFISFANNTSTDGKVRLGSSGNNLVLSTNYTPRVTIANSGKVGIGDSTPTANGLTLFSSVTGAVRLNLHIGGSGTVPNSGSYNTISNNQHGDILISSNAYINGNGNPVITSTHGNMGGTGIKISGASLSHDIKFYTSGAASVRGTEQTNTERMTISSTGNVGIGTATPSTKLDISTSGADGITLNADTVTATASSRLFFNNGTAGKAVGLFNSFNALRFTVLATPGTSTGTEKMRLTEAGFLSLGGHAPATVLDIANVGGAHGLALNADANNATLSSRLFFNNGTAGKAISIMNNGNNLSISTAATPGSGSGSEKVRILENGNVGIGTTNPTMVGAGKGLVINGGANQARFALRNDATGDSSGAGFHLVVTSGSGSNGGQAILEQRQNNIIAFKLYGSEAMRILPAGNVGIGEVNPLHPLHVDGTIYSTNNIQLNSTKQVLFGNGNQYIKGTNDTSVEIGTGGTATITATHAGNVEVSGTVDGRDIAADGTKLDGIEASATADQTKADIEGLGIDVPATNLTGTIPAARLSTATTQAESDDSTKIATTAYVVDKITTLIGGAPSTLNDLNELAAAINDDANYNTTLTTALGTKLPLAGGTMTGNITFGDNTKAIFGAGSDLQMYHDGNHSIIRETGAGNMYLQDDNYVEIGSASGEVYIGAIKDGAVNLRYDNVKKIETTSTGVDVTGSLSAESISVNTGTPVSSSPSAHFRRNHGAQAYQQLPGLALYWNTSNGLQDNTIVYGSSTNSSLKFTHANGTAFNDRLIINSSGNVGIGTSSPGYKLEVAGTTRVTSMSSNPGSGAGLESRYDTSGNWGGLLSYNRGTASYQELRLEGSTIKIIESGETTPTFTVNDSKVGIGTTSPQRTLHVVKNGSIAAGNGYDVAIFQNNDAAGIRLVDAGDGGSNGGNAGLGNDNGNLNIAAAGVMTFSTNLAANAALYGGASTGGTERMRITSAGSLTLNPNSSGATYLNLNTGATDDGHIIIQRNGSNKYQITSGTTNALQFYNYTAGGESMRIDSSGNLIIGKTSESSNTAGHFLSESGYLRSTRNGSIQVLNRITTDGEVISIQKDGATRGSIGVNNGDPFISRASGSGMRWYNGAVVPTNDAGNDSNNTMDLGSNGVRFKHGYFSGNLYGNGSNLTGISSGPIWVIGNTSGGISNDSGMSSGTYLGTGQVQWNFDSTLSTSSYGGSATCRQTNGSHLTPSVSMPRYGSSQSTSSCSMGMGECGGNGASGRHEGNKADVKMVVHI